MIFTDRTIIVQKGISSINDTIILYRGDKGVEIRFTLNEGSPFKFGSGASPNIIEKTEAAYGQLIIKTPNDLPAVFSEIAPTNEGKIVFTITAEMIDEITEVGNYTFQIRLLDESRNSRATLPEVVNGIEIREPIASEDVSTTNEVGAATVGYALTTADATEDAFDTQGNYNKTTWGTGDRITAAKLNKMEAGIDGVNQKVASGGTGSNNASDIPIADTGNYFTNSDVEGALQEVGSQIKENSYNIDNIKTIIEGINCSPKSVYATLNDLKSAFPNGDDNIYVVSEDGGWYYWKETAWVKGGDYQSTIISDDSIELKHVNFIENINYFNKSNILINGYYNHETFEWNNLEGVSQTEDIPCQAGDTIYFTARSNSDTYKAVFKNNNKDIIKGVFIDNTTAHDDLTFCFTVPSGVSYFTLMFYNDQIDTFMITINKPCPLLYHPYNGLKNLSSGIRIDGDNVTLKAIEKKHVNYKTVEDYIVEYEDGSVNIFNKNKMSLNSFWSAQTLQLVRYEGINFSNFIKCEETDTIRIKVNNIGSNYHVVFKNKEGHVFDGIFYVSYPNEIITIRDVPKDAWYFGVNVYDVDVNAMMITINNEMPSSYQEYKASKLELSDNLISAIKSINNSNNDNSSDDDYLANRLLVWEEDFSGNEIDRTSWINLCRKDGSGNNQLEYNTARSKNCRIVNNQLIIEARREHYKGKGWTSANLNTSNLHEFQYGRIEAKIKLPNSHGIWPAFWMMGANADLSTDENDEFIYTGLDWPTCGEIDIFEYWGRNSGGRLAGALHYASDTNNTLGSKEIYEVLEGQNNYDPTEWHIYGIEWTEDKIDFLVDNEVKGTAPLEQFTLSNGYNPFRLPHYIILNVAVDIADNTTDKNNLMFVDWVRVYAPENVESYVNPTGITLNTNTVTLNVGDERVPSLQANILPIDASEKTVIWESSNDDIVVVGGGSLTAKKQGTCEIIARTLNGYEARCVVTVN